MSLNRTVAFVAFAGSLLWFSREMQSDTILPLETPARVFGLHEKLQLLAIGNNSGKVMIWDLTSKKPLREFDRTKHGVDSLAFTRSGQQIVIVSDDDVVYKYRGGAVSIAVNPDIKGSGIKARVHSVGTGEEQGVLKSPQSLNCARIDPSGKWLVATSYSKVEIWETETWKHIATHEDFLPCGLNSLAFPPNGAFVAVAGREGDILFLGLPDLNVVDKVRVAKGAISGLTFIDNGNKCVCGGLDGTLHVVDATTKKHLSSITGFGVIVKWTPKTGPP